MSLIKPDILTVMTKFASTLTTVVAEMKAKPGFEDQLRQELLAMAVETNKEDGCVQYDLHESTGQKGAFLFYENWTSPEALAKHGGSPHISAFRAIRSDLLDEPARILIYNRIA